MAERKVSKPRVVRMWAVWYVWGRLPTLIREDRFLPHHTDNETGRRIVRVEVREVKPRKSGKGKVKHGR